MRTAADESERLALWKGRKSAFGAVARIAPDYYLHDTVVPRTRLVEVLASVRAIAARRELQVLNVFHAGDGNLHPLLLFDAREPGMLERVQLPAVRSSRHRSKPAGCSPGSTGSVWRSGRT